MRGELYLVPVSLHSEDAFTNSLPLEYVSGMPRVNPCSPERVSGHAKMIAEAWKLTKRVWASLG